MTVYSKVSYDDQGDGRILKRCKEASIHYFSAPIVFFNDELKAKLSMKTKK
jgi:hypothetical protein